MQLRGLGPALIGDRVVGFFFVLTADALADFDVNPRQLAYKNLLDKEELYRLHILSEQFLLYAEATALAGRRMTMASLHKQLDRLLELNDYPVFPGWKVYLKDEAERHARLEHTLYKKRKKIESMGIEYDEEALAAGEYDDILIDG